jgi:hypothetical protein
VRNALPVVALLLVACSGKAAQPAEFSAFIPVKVGDQIPPICTADNDGNRYTLAGVFKLPDASSISDGKTNLDFYQKLNAAKEGDGQSFQVTVKSPGDINDLWKTAEDVKGKGYNTKEGTIYEDSLIIRTADGDAKAGDPLQLTVELEAVKNFQSDAITACMVNFVSATKVK